ncbi:MAG TPA: TlpA disulfide reductase family protein [Candidatus Polarisedimenticolia bacterium]|nr:TlpA disulfide reductase family protein [Candidatus Polarisedimenticolia bacterium]
MLTGVLAMTLLLSEAARPPITATFRREVANLEFFEGRLWEEPHASLSGSPSIPGALWYGAITRRLPGDSLRDASHFLGFAAEYAGSVASRAWCDTDGNGDLRDNEPLRLFAYPSPRGARSFLVDLRWTAQAGARSIPVESTIRVVLEPPPDPGKPPTYRLQRVHAMVGDVALAGRSHRAFLYDGNGDGLYAREFPDGLYVDLDDDLHFDIDPMSPGFAPLGAPFVMGERSHEIVSVDPEGLRIALRDTGPAEALEQAVVGRAAPGFSYTDLEGRTLHLEDYRGRVVLLYFWASWCGGCADQAPGLSALYERYRAEGLEILGVSFDTELEPMRSFRASHGQGWPTSFSGRSFWEDPIGKLYRARTTGSMYLIDRQGRLQGIFTEMEELSGRLGDLIAAPGAAARPAR